MNSGINVNDPRVASAFLAALRHEGLVAVLIFATLGLAWVTIRAWGRADRGYLAALGAGGRELGGYDMVVSPAAGGRGRGGAPGAAAIYVVAGGLIALPERSWRSRLLGQAVLAGTGFFLLGMAVLQAWPGRGFWQGISHGRPGTLAGMTQTMARIPQPRSLASLITSFTTFDEAHGFAVTVVLSGSAGLIETRPGGAWQSLPALPAGTQTLAIGPGTAIQAIAPAGSAITIWAINQPDGQWTRLQRMAIPIKYGSSG